ncbi:MAG: mercuric transport protein MerTP [Chitinophagaceae bacterium]
MSIGKLAGTSIITAVAASLCCITPVLALVAGTGGIASTFSWLEPARPYLIGITIIVLGISWYLKLKPQPTDECGCVAEKPGFIQSKTFLLIITLFSALMIAFPSYAKFFYSNDQSAVINADPSTIRSVELSISGMTCAACEEHVTHELKKLPGIIESTVSYKNKNALIRFDDSKTNIKDITSAVNATGYKVTNSHFKK